MARFDGSLARQLEFEDITTTTTSFRRGRLRLAAPAGGLTGRDKYRVLEHRRRQAQIKARRLLELAGSDGE